MWYQLCEIHKHRVVSYQVRIYLGAVRTHAHSFMSEGGARSWLAGQGIPFHKQHRFLTVIKGV